jgi:hypothetical protein
LPAPGDYWSREQRKRWLDMMTLAFDMIYTEEPTAEPTEPGTMHPHHGS